MRPERIHYIRSLQSLMPMNEPELGMTPGLNELASQDLDEIRVSVSALLRVRRFSSEHLIHPAIRKRQVGQSSAVVV